MVSAIQNMNPDQTLKKSIPISTPKRMLRSCNRRGAMSGWAFSRSFLRAFSTITQTSGTIASSAAFSGHDQCHCGPSAIGNIRQHSIAVSRTVPVQSMRDGVSRRVSGT